MKEFNRDDRNSEGKFSTTHTVIDVSLLYLKSAMKAATAVAVSAMKS